MTKPCLAQRIEQTERQLQTDVVKLLSVILPHGTFFTAIPGGDRGVTTTPGYVAGTPDIHICYCGRAIYIELKKPKKGRVESHQKYVHEQIILAGGAVGVCRSLEDVSAFLGMLMPLRQHNLWKAA